MISKLIRAALALQIISGVFWTLTMAMMRGQGGLEVLAQFLLVFALQTVCLLIGGWVHWRHPAERKIARWVLLLPFVFWFLPGVLKTLAGGQLTSAMLWVGLAGLAAVILVACILVPQKIAGKLPDFLFRSRFFNTLILIGPLLGWVVFISAVLVAFGMDGHSSAKMLSGNGTGYGLASAIVIAALYLITLGGGSLCSGIWGWVGLHSGIDGACRKLNIAQLVLATPGLLVGAIAVVVMIA